MADAGKVGREVFIQFQVLPGLHKLRNRQAGGARWGRERSDRLIILVYENRFAGIPDPSQTVAKTADRFRAGNFFHDIVQNYVKYINL